MLRITDNNYSVKCFQQFGILPRMTEVDYGTPQALARGITPIEEKPDLLIPEDEWKERILEAESERSFPVHHLKANNAKAKSQGRTNFCWAYGISTATEAFRCQENQEYVRLAPATLGWLVGWRNKGFYLTETIAGAAREGIASSEFAEDGVSDKRGFITGWEENRKKYKPMEWFDTVGKRAGAKTMLKQCVSLLLGAKVPGYIAYNWWGHALAMVGLKWDEKYSDNIVWLAWNSHGDGLIELTGNRGIPDEFYGLRSTTYSPSNI